MKPCSAAKRDLERREFQRLALELLALNLDFESARFPDAKSGFALAEEIREIVEGGKGKVTG